VEGRLELAAETSDFRPADLIGQATRSTGFRSPQAVIFGRKKFRHLYVKFGGC
jgi:hypothetical protein